MEPKTIERVPRTPQEQDQLLVDRPPAWEYLLWGAVLFRSLNALDPKWRKYEHGKRRPAAGQLVQGDPLDPVTDAFAQAVSLIEAATAPLKSPEAQEAAFGKLGESGDPAKIIASAETIMSGYEGLLDWSANLRAEGVPPRFREIYDAAARLADSPIHELRDFVERVVRELDQVPAALRQGLPLQLELRLTLSIGEEDQRRFQQSLDDSLAQMKRELEVFEPSTPVVDVAIPSGLGFFGARRARKTAKHYQAELATWAAERDACLERLALARRYSGESTTAILLKRDEALFASITNSSLIEERRGAGQWKGRSRGVSVPVLPIPGLGTVRYRTGSTLGHYVQGAPIPTAIDVGVLYVTNQRVIFQGQRQTRECRFDKLVGYQHTDDGSTIFSVSNRQKPTQVHYGPGLSGWFDFRLDLALAHFRGTVAELVQQVEADLAAIAAAEPKAPEMAAPQLPSSRG